MLDKAININGVTDLIINKVDILREVGKWNLRSGTADSIHIQLGSEAAWTRYITKYLKDIKVTFSDNPERI
jgi:adenylosuccinate synthase